MGTDYGRRLREKGISMPGFSQALGPRTWYAWLALTLDQRARWAKKNGLALSGFSPGVAPKAGGDEALGRFKKLFAELSTKQRRAFLVRAGLRPKPLCQAIGVPEQESSHTEERT